MTSVSRRELIGLAMGAAVNLAGAPPLQAQQQQRLNWQQQLLDAASRQQEQHSARRQATQKCGRLTTADVLLDRRTIG